MPLTASPAIADGSLTSVKLASSLRNQFRKIAGLADFGGDGSDGALTVTSGSTNVSGFKQYSSISVSAGATINLTGNWYALCTGTISILGAITSASRTTSALSAQDGANGTYGKNPQPATRGGMSNFDFLRYEYRRLAIGGGHGGTTVASVGSSNASVGAQGAGGAGWGAGANGAGLSSGDGVSQAGGAGKYGFCLESMGSISFGSASSVNLSGSAGAGSGTYQGGGAGGAYGLLASLADISIASGATFTSNGASALTQGGGGFFGFYYGGTYSNLGTMSVTGAEAGLVVSRALTFI